MDTMAVELAQPLANALGADPDTPFVVGFVRGETRAFRHLVEKYKRRAYYVALGLVGSPDDAWDLSQEAFIRAWRNRRRFNPNHPFWPWFYAVLANLCKNCLRDREVRVRHAEAIRLAEQRRRDELGNPEAILQKNEIQKQVWEAIQMLPFKFREIIILRHFQDLAYEDIAEQLGIPEGSVMSRLFYARKKLREILENPRLKGRE